MLVQSRTSSVSTGHRIPLVGALGTKTGSSPAAFSISSFNPFPLFPSPSSCTGTTCLRPRRAPLSPLSIIPLKGPTERYHALYSLEAAAALSQLRTVEFIFVHDDGDADDGSHDSPGHQSPCRRCGIRSQLWPSCKPSEPNQSPLPCVPP
jgi:hypothetical protein